MNLTTLTYENIEALQFDTNHDPVRPELDLNFRLGPGRRVYVLETDGKYQAAICVAYTNEVPTTVKELDLMSQAACQEDQHGSICIAYTVWSRAPRAGRDIVFRLLDECRANDNVKRLVTLSPKTDMARRFHLNNGAVTLQNNTATDNYEYSL